MRQSISVITIATADIARSRRFYVEGFGWRPVFENDDIVFYQMNGFVFGTWLQASMEEDMRRTGMATPGGFSLAHNVGAAGEVEPLIAALVAAGGRLLRPADAPPYGGLRGYVADPDDHAWEIAWNPAWTMDQEGRVSFAV